MKRIVFIILFGSISLLQGANLSNQGESNDGFPEKFFSKDIAENVHTPTNDTSEQPTCPNAPIAQRTITLQEMPPVPPLRAPQSQNSSQTTSSQSVPMDDIESEIEDNDTAPSSDDDDEQIS